MERFQIPGLASVACLQLAQGDLWEDTRGRCGAKVASKSTCPSAAGTGEGLLNALEQVRDGRTLQEKDHGAGFV